MRGKRYSFREVLPVASPLPALALFAMVADAIPLRKRTHIIAGDGFNPITNAERVIEAIVAYLSDALLGDAHAKRELGNRFVMPPHQSLDFIAREFGLTPNGPARSHFGHANVI